MVRLIGLKSYSHLKNLLSAAGHPGIGRRGMGKKRDPFEGLFLISRL
jgi:hypothetical protein